MCVECASGWVSVCVCQVRSTGAVASRGALYLVAFMQKFGIYDRDLIYSETIYLYINYYYFLKSNYGQSVDYIELGLNFL